MTSLSNVGVGLKDLESMDLLRKKLNEKGISLQRAVIKWDCVLSLWSYEFYDPSGSVGFIASSGFLAENKDTSVEELVDLALGKINPRR